MRILITRFLLCSYVYLILINGETAALSDNKWYTPFHKFLKAFIELVVHIAIVIAILGGIDRKSVV